jgi:hypothetical protein
MKKRENPWLYAPTGADRKIGERLRYLLEAATVASDGLFTHTRPFTVPAGLSLSAPSLFFGRKNEEEGGGRRRDGR